MNGLLNRVIRYWHECLLVEDVLGKDISLNVRSRAILSPTRSDPFICGGEGKVCLDETEGLKRFQQRTALQNLDVYYGYPLYCYFDETAKKAVVAPLLVVKVDLNRSEGKLWATRAESIPLFGAQALGKLGLRIEEISDLNNRLELIFSAGSAVSPNACWKNLYDLVCEECDVPVGEPINPDTLSTSATGAKVYGLLNKSMFFSSEVSAFNANLLRDLDELSRKNDLDSSALGFITGSKESRPRSSFTPLLPVQYNEYQLAALRSILGERLSVVTGPPGTGKSQFITLLLVNILFQGKTCLFVSHTNEAVGVVTKNLNELFSNILIRTGSKEHRQSVPGSVNELFALRSRASGSRTRWREVEVKWRHVETLHKRLVERDEQETHLLEQLRELDDQTSGQRASFNIMERLRSLFVRVYLQIKIALLTRALESTPTKSELEKQLVETESSYVSLCCEYVKTNYLDRLLSNKKSTGAVRSFVNSVAARGWSDEIDADLFQKALVGLPLWCSTLKSVRGSFPLVSNAFDYVIFDEASQVDLPSAAPALYRARSAIVVGDPMQLSHIAGITNDVDKQIAVKHGLTSTLGVYPHRIRYTTVSLYRAAENSLTHPPILLASHYRSEDEIIALCNDTFYSGRLKIETSLDWRSYPKSLPRGVQWIDCAGVAERFPSGSRINRKEVECVVDLVKETVQNLRDTKLTIGIVTPYSRQQFEISTRLLSELGQETLDAFNIKVLTAHKFQGSERDIMICSLVVAGRGDGGSDRWYNLYPQILNVALSRARRLLYIVGDKRYCLSRNGVLGTLANKFDALSKERDLERQSLHEQFDSVPERMLYSELAKRMSEMPGYKLIPKVVSKRYTLDLAVVGPRKFDIECDGSQHELIDGIPISDDIRRDMYLEQQGWEVVRIPNYRILTALTRVGSEVVERVLRTELSE